MGLPSSIPLLPPSALPGLPWSGAPMPVAFVDLARGDPVPLTGPLPPFPVIGLGPAGELANPCAAALDGVITDLAEADLIARNCARNPHAAAVLVQLLRLIEPLPPHHALAAESMAYGLLQAGAEHQDWLARRGPAPGRRPEPEAPPVRVDRAGGDLIVWLDRPGTLNAVDRTMRDGLREAFEVAASDPEITRVVLRGRGRAFSVGAELGEFGTTTDPAVAHAIRGQTLPALALLGCADKLETHIDGACIGAGLEMAAFARMVSASARAWFQLPELGMGLIPGAGGCVSLTRRIGRQRTARLVLTGRRLSARQACDWGLVDHIVAD